jgi:hypothetical protein
MFRNDDMRGEGGGGGGLGSNRRSLAELEDATTAVGLLSSTMAVGLLSSTQLYLLEVEVPGLIVGRISTASHALFRNHPRDNGIVGECLLHWVDLPSAKALRTAVAQSASTLDIQLRTWQHVGIVSITPFSVQRIGAREAATGAAGTATATELWMLSPLDVREPTPTLFGWTVEKMRDVSGVYAVDACRSSQPLWRTIDMTQTMASQKGGGGSLNAQNIAISALTSSDASKQVIHAIGMPPGTQFACFTSTKVQILTQKLV